ncbi:MAG: TIGR03905 family TSCPD domain-containing protein [Lachnospiraceae bacterium]|nr:TIGR03905 family TSCPD domain-containing protein [Lachnospiraceae bacterium]
MIYKTRGVCSSAIELELDNDIVKKVQFIGGCDGNTKGVARLVEGMKAEEAISRLEGITCGFKPTSCPDQLAKALRQALEKSNTPQ